MSNDCIELVSAALTSTLSGADLKKMKSDCGSVILLIYSFGTLDHAMLKTCQATNQLWQPINDHRLLQSFKLKCEHCSVVLDLSSSVLILLVLLVPSQELNFAICTDPI